MAATRNIIESLQQSDQPAQADLSVAATQATVNGFSVNFTIPYEQLKIGQYLNNGSTANVYVGNFAGKQVAIKQLTSQTQEYVALFLKEHEMLQELSSYSFNGVIKYYGLSICQNPRSYNLVMEFATGREIFDMIYEFAINDDVLPLDITYKILKKTTYACAQLHEKKYVHGDLNWSNVLFGDNEEIKIADFGLTVKLEDKPYKIVNCQGTPAFMAPEIINKAMISPAADIFALGSMMYQIATGTTPFSTMDNKELFAKVSRGENQIIPLSCPYQLAELISQCWKFDPAQRPSAKTLHEKIVELEKDIRLELKA